MNTINKDELFHHVREFLKTKGIELQQGSYSQTIQKGCQVLADTINLSQQAVERARTEVQRNLERVRQTIHEKTAPRKSTSASDKEAAAGKPPVMTEAGPVTKPETESEPEATAAKSKAKPKRSKPAPRAPRKRSRPTGRGE